MERRELLRLSVGALLTGALGTTMSPVLARDTAGAEDIVASVRYNKERRFLATSYGRIAYIDRGTGDAVLFLHGFPLSSFQWRGAIDRLSSDRRCIAPDLMGLGYTEVAENQSVAPSAQVDMITALLDGLSIQKVDLIANDSGGAIAQLFMTKHRERVRTLMLTNCDVEADSPPAALLPVIDLARSELYADLWLEPWLHHRDVARSATGLGGMCYSDPNQPTDAALEQYLGPLVESLARKKLINRYAVSLAPNALLGIEPELRKCTVPTYIVWGMRDKIFSNKNSDYLYSVLPQMMGIRRLPSAKLFFPEEHPDIIASESRKLWELSSVRFFNNA
jgi:pimeloyl-ACP methyl ester carboxylesterase